MDVNSLFARYEVAPAVAAQDPKYRDWVYTPARLVDTSSFKDKSLVRDLSLIMEEALIQFN